jgi:hypothetical protein
MFGMIKHFAQHLSKPSAVTKLTLVATYKSWLAKMRRKPSPLRARMDRHCGGSRIQIS